MLLSSVTCQPRCGDAATELGPRRASLRAKWRFSLGVRTRPASPFEGFSETRLPKRVKNSPQLITTRLVGLQTVASTAGSPASPLPPPPSPPPLRRCCSAQSRACRWLQLSVRGRVTGPPIFSNHQIGRAPTHIEKESGGQGKPGEGCNPSTHMSMSSRPIPGWIDAVASSLLPAKLPFRSSMRVLVPVRVGTER